MTQRALLPRIPALLGLPDTKWYRSWVYFGDFQTSTDSRLDHRSTERLPCWFCFFNFFIAFLSTGPEVLLWQSVFLAQLSLFALICYKRHGRLGVKKQVTYLLSYNRHGWLRVKNQFGVPIKILTTLSLTIFSSSKNINGITSENPLHCLLYTLFHVWRRFEKKIKVQWSGKVYIRKAEGLAENEAREATFWSTPVLTLLLLQDVKHARLHSDRLLS